jgi:hypothetical protein
MPSPNSRKHKRNRSRSKSQKDITHWTRSRGNVEEENSNMAGGKGDGKSDGKSGNGASQPTIDDVLQAIGKLTARIDSFEESVLGWRTDITSRTIALEVRFEQFDENGIKETANSAHNIAEKAEATVGELLTRVKKLESMLIMSFKCVYDATNKNSELIKSLQRKLRESNIRMQGVQVKAEETELEAAFRTLSKAVSDLKMDDISEASIVIPRPKKPGEDNVDGVRGAVGGASNENSDETPKPKIPNLLIKFRNRKIRDKVYITARKNKDKMKEHPDIDVIVREDMIQADMRKYQLAKKQMDFAFNKQNKKTKFEWGKLWIDGKVVPVDGEESLKRLQLPDFEIWVADLRRML